MSLQWSWRELEHLAKWLKPDIEGAFVEKVFIPARPEHPNGFLKNEWALRLSQRTRGLTLIFSVRPQEVYLDLLSDGKIKPAQGASHSGFDLFLHKTLQGLRVERLETFPGDRRLILWFRAEDSKSDPQQGLDPASQKRIGLLLQLIPSMPEAILIESLGESDTWTALSRSRLKEKTEGWRAEIAGKDLEKKENVLAIDPKARLPGDTLRKEIFSSRETYERFVRDELLRQFLRLKLSAEQKQKNADLKKLEQNLKTAVTQQKKAQNEPDYGFFGKILKSQIYLFQPPMSQGSQALVWRSPISLTDWETEETVEIPIDESLSPKDQLEKFFWLEKRKKRRLEESEERTSLFQSRVDALKLEITELKKLAIDLEKAGSNLFELKSHVDRLLTLSPAATPVGLKEKERGKLLEWGGKTYTSKESLTILVGRNKRENLELTLKIARGNDLWLHLKGRPGSHVVILLRDRKSASLETLLDAAFLCIFYSGGKDWGKADVDYTFRKFVKRIKDSDEVSYTQNKTLSVTLDRVRLQALFDQTT
jgi:predicted ribosome quality control (RQC) complex YloA/Tae2 family protein